MTQIHYKPGCYAGEKPYRGLLVDVLNHFGYNRVTGEFWSLGGPESLEFLELRKQGLMLDDYPNVDRGSIKKVEGITIHPFTEFMDIRDLWTNPQVLAFDSTEGLVSSRDTTWAQFKLLLIEACHLSSEVVFTSNFLTNYRGLKDYDGWRDTCKKWLFQLRDRAKFEGMRLDIHKTFIHASKQSSKTEMLGFGGRLVKN